MTDFTQTYTLAVVQGREKEGGLGLIDKIKVHIMGLALRAAMSLALRTVVSMKDLTNKIFLFTGYSCGPTGPRFVQRENGW